MREPAEPLQSTRVKLCALSVRFVPMKWPTKCMDSRPESRRLRAAGQGGKPPSRCERNAAQLERFAWAFIPEARLRFPTL